MTTTMTKTTTAENAAPGGRRRHAMRSLLAALALTASLFAVAAPADAATVGPSGTWELGSDLQCGNGTVFESLPVAQNAAIGQTAWQITQILTYHNGRWEHHAWSEYRISRVNGFGSAGPVWTPWGSNYGVRQATYDVPHGTYLLLQWVHADGAWNFRAPIASNGAPFCAA